jgi:DNA end-binding protein Ku
MANSIWKGYIAFGLVAFPVKLHAAARSQALSFNQLQQCDHSRVKQVLYCQAEDQPLSRNELVKGYEYEKDRYVVVEEGELAQISPRSSRVMEVLEFVPEAEVDAVYLDAFYYVAPERAGEKPYTLLYEALRRTGQAALAQLTMHNREHLVLLRPGRCGLMLHTLFYRDEIRALEEFRTDTEWVAPQELELARLLVESLDAHFEPAKYKDNYRESLRALIDAKIRGEELKLPGATEPTPPPVTDILEALKASLARTKKPVLVAQQPPQAAPAPKRTRKAIAS